MNKNVLDFFSMKLLSWYASFGEELRGLRGTVLGRQKYYVRCLVCFVYRMQSKLQGFFLFLRHSLKLSDKWPTTSEVAPFFLYDLTYVSS